MVASALLEGTAPTASSICSVSAPGKWPSVDEEEHRTRKNMTQEPRSPGASLCTSVFLDLQNHGKRRPLA